MRPPPHKIPPLGPPKRSPRERVLAEWRGLNMQPDERATGAPARPIGKVLDNVLHKELRLDQRRAEAEILSVWNRLVDPDVVAHARPTGLAKGTLFVSVDSSVWLSEIVRYRRKEILERLQSSFGRNMIARISFRAG